MPILDNPRWERFAQLLAKGKTQDEAYQLAGYRADRGGASRLAAKANVRGRVKEILSRGAERAEITEAMVLQELAKIGFADIRKAIKWGRKKEDVEDAEETNEIVLVNSDELDDDTAAAVAEVSQLSNGGIRLKLHDKLAALNDLGRHFGAFKDRVDLGGQVQLVNTELLDKLSTEERAEMRKLLLAAAARDG